MTTDSPVNWQTKLNYWRSNKCKNVICNKKSGIPRPYNGNFFFLFFSVILNLYTFFPFYAVFLIFFHFFCVYILKESVGRYFVFHQRRFIFITLLPCVCGFNTRSICQLPINELLMVNNHNNFCWHDRYQPTQHNTIFVYIVWRWQYGEKLKKKKNNKKYWNKETNVTHYTSKYCKYTE